MKKYRLSIITLDGQYQKDETHKTFASKKKARKKLEKFMVSTQIPLFVAYRVCLNKINAKPWNFPIVYNCLNSQMVP